MITTSGKYSFFAASSISNAIKSSFTISIFSVALSKIVGHGDAGRIISKTVSIVTTAATMAIAGKAVASGATNIASAAAIGRESMK